MGHRSGGCRDSAPSCFDVPHPVCEDNAPQGRFVSNPGFDHAVESVNEAGDSPRAWVVIHGKPISSFSACNRRSGRVDPMFPAMNAVQGR